MIERYRATEEGLCNASQLEAEHAHDRLYLEPYTRTIEALMRGTPTVELPMEVQESLADEQGVEILERSMTDAAEYFDVDETQIPGVSVRLPENYFAPALSDSTPRHLSEKEMKVGIAVIWTTWAGLMFVANHQDPDSAFFLNDEPAVAEQQVEWNDQMVQNKILELGFADLGTMDACSGEDILPPESVGPDADPDTIDVLSISKDAQKVVLTGANRHIEVEEGVQVEELYVCGSGSSVLSKTNSYIDTLGVEGAGAYVQTHGDLNNAVLIGASIEGTIKEADAIKLVGASTRVEISDYLGLAITHPQFPDQGFIAGESATIEKIIEE